MKTMKKLLALLMALTLSFGLCSCTDSGETGEDITLKWYFLGDTTLADNDKVYDLVDQKVREKLGFGVEMIPIDFSAYSQKMQMVLSGGEEFDICWTSNWSNDYFTNVANGAFISLDELLEKTPALKNSIDRKIWDGVKRDGKIYAVPNQQIMARSACLLFPEELSQKYKSTLEGVDSYEELTPYMAAFGKDYPDTGKVSPSWNNLMYAYGFDKIVGCVATSFEGDPKDIKVFNMYDTDEWRRVIAVRNEWTKNAYTIVANEGSGSGDWNGRPVDIPVAVDCYKPGLLQEKEKTMKYPVEIIRISEPYLASDGINATLNAISATSQHPEEAIKLLELVNTDPEIINLITYGIEGEHYTKVAENTIKVHEDAAFRNDSWVFGNVFNTYLLEGNDANTWVETKEINDSAKPSKLLGFSVDTTPIKLQLTNCNSVTEKYMTRLHGGFGDSLELNKQMNEELKVAGIDIVIAEIQKQIDEWLTKQN